MITVIATGFSEDESPAQKSFSNPSISKLQSQVQPRREQSQREDLSHSNERQKQQQTEDSLDIPTFLRNRNRR